MYLVDTNIWLERLLGQAKSDEVGDFLDHISSSELYVTDFSFHSICVILTRLKKEKVLLDFVQDVFVDGAVNLTSVLVFTHQTAPSNPLQVELKLQKTVRRQSKIC